jgi:hypothetical protein
VEPYAQRAFGKVGTVVHGPLLDERGQASVGQTQVGHHDRVSFDPHRACEWLNLADRDYLGGFHGRTIGPTCASLRVTIRRHSENRTN